MKRRVHNYGFWLSALLVISASACNLNTTLPTSTSGPIVVATSTSVPKQQGVAPVDLPLNHTDQATDTNSSVDATKKRAPGGRFICERPL